MLMLRWLGLACLALLAVGCARVPGGAVATVDGRPIDRAEFAHWLDVTVRWSRQADAVVPDRENGYPRCIAVKRESAPAGAGRAELRRRCERDKRLLREEVMRVLISLRWLQGEADAMRIAVSDATVRSALEEQKQQTFLREADYDAFLKRTGTTETDMLQSARLAVLTKLVYAHALKRDNRVTDREIQAFYDRNRGRFNQPETRDLNVVVTRTKRAARQARAALERGESWGAVVEHHSVDSATKARGGALPARARGMLEFELDDAVFAATQGQIAGPVQASDGYYVFSVTAIHEAGQQGLRKARATIAQLLRSQRQHDVLKRFNADFRQRWRAKTTCAKGYEATDCQNGPRAR